MYRYLLLPLSVLHVSDVPDVSLIVLSTPSHATAAAATATSSPLQVGQLALCGLLSRPVRRLRVKAVWREPGMFAFRFGGARTVPGYVPRGRGV